MVRSRLNKGNSFLRILKIPTHESLVNVVKGQYTAKIHNDYLFERDGFDVKTVNYHSKNISFL